MRIETLGEHAVVVHGSGVASLSSQRELWALARLIRDVDGVDDAVVGLGNVTAWFSGRIDVAAIERCVRRNAGPHDTQEQTLIELSTRYGGEFGPDLAEIAAHRDCTPEDVIQLHAAREYVVYFMGYRPGFAYLGDVDERIACARKATPRTRVPAGSVGIADALTGIYPSAAPGGWNIIGRCDRPLFDPNAPEPSLLHPGARVRFVPVE